MDKTIKNPLLIVALIILILIIVSTLKNTSRQSSSVTASKAPDSLCDASAKKYFDNFVTDEDTRSAGIRTTTILERYYKSNLSDVRGRCYVEIVEKSGDSGGQFLMKNVFDVDGAPKPVDYALKDTYYAGLGIMYLASGATDLSVCVTSLNPNWQIGGSDISVMTPAGTSLVSKCNSLEEFDSKVFELYGIK